MQEKKKYEKPEIKKVSLVAEEAVLAGCKRAVDVPTGPDFELPCYVTACKTIGS